MTERKLVTAARSGDQRKALEALRDRLAFEASTAEGSQLAALSKQLVDVLGKLDGLKVPEVSKRDDIKAQREKRRASAGASVGAKLPKEQRTGGGRARRKRGAAPG